MAAECHQWFIVVSGGHPPEVTHTDSARRVPHQRRAALSLEYQSST